MKTKLYVAIPTTGTQCDAQVYALRALEKKYGDRIEFIYPKSCVRRVFHDYARNAMVDEFLASDADIMWFLDSDVSPADHVLDLITEHKDKWMVAGAPYPVFMVPKEDEHPQVVMTVYQGASDEGYHPAKIPYEGTDFVDGIATGCLFIKRELFAELPRPYFEFKFNPETRYMTEGEDMGFMRKVNAAGHKFFIDYSMVCKHYKTVDLLDVNNYAIGFANIALKNLEAQLRAEFKIAAVQMVQDIKRKLQAPQIITEWK